MKSHSNSQPYILIWITYEYNIEMSGGVSIISNMIDGADGPTPKWQLRMLGPISGPQTDKVFIRWLPGDADAEQAKGDYGRRWRVWTRLGPTAAGGPANNTTGTLW